MIPESLKVELVKITFNPNFLPKIKDHIKCWSQLRVIDEGEDFIVFMGHRHVMDTVLYCDLANYVKRHINIENSYFEKYYNREYIDDQRLKLDEIDDFYRLFPHKFETPTNGNEALVNAFRMAIECL